MARQERDFSLFERDVSAVWAPKMRSPLFGVSERDVSLSRAPDPMRTKILGGYQARTRPTYTPTPAVGPGARLVRRDCDVSATWSRCEGDVSAKIALRYSSILPYNLSSYTYPHTFRSLRASVGYNPTNIHLQMTLGFVDFMLLLTGSF